jgi:hypothetical protein
VNKSAGPAGVFDGDLHVTGEIELVGADCAEAFDANAETAIEPGTVMVIDDEGAMRVGEEPYDKRVAGVVTGAGSFRPGIVLGKQQTDARRVSLALVGKTYCKVDASYAEIEAGDLLTSSPTPGFAMSVSEPERAVGAVIGKALRPWARGRGLIPILVTMQ